MPGQGEALIFLLWLLIGACLGGFVGWSFGGERIASALALTGGVAGAGVGAWIVFGGSDGLLGAMRFLSMAIIVAVFVACVIASVLGRI